MLKILSLDPSGTGTTGICLIDKRITFQEFQHKDWIKHREHLHNLLLDFQPNLVLYETTNYINSRGKDMTSLLKLLGALEVLPLEKVESIPVNQVKDLKAELLAGTKKIAGLACQPGRGKGWMFKGTRISLHQLDAYLVYWLWKEKNAD